jgi:5'-nucleotidase
MYLDYVEISKRLTKFLKEEKGCHIVIALTHMRVPNEKRLAKLVPELDLALGGHDHIYF